MVLIYQIHYKRLCADIGGQNTKLSITCTPMFVQSKVIAYRPT